MAKRRLSYRFASPAYAHQRWPNSRAMLPLQTSAHLTQLSLFDCCLLAGLSPAARCRQNTGISHKAIAKLAKAQDKMMRLNAYHNRAHICQVILAAGLLSDEAKLSQKERDILLVAALVHDYGHLGHRRNKSAYWQEAASCGKALPMLFGKTGDSRLIGVFYDLVLATSPQADDLDSSKPSNEIVNLLCDADLFASLFLPKKEVDRLTACLKFEERLVMPLSHLRDGFLQKCTARGLASIAGRVLHSKLSASMTYFGGT